MKRLSAWVEAGLKQLLFVLMLLIAVSVIWQVISRYVFGDPATWPDEVARFSMIWVALLGGVYVYAQDKHLAVTILPERWAGSVRGHLLQMTFHVLVALLGVLAIAGGASVATTNFVNGQLSSVLNINMGYVYVAVPVTGALLVLYAICFIVERWRSACALEVVPNG